MSMGAVLRVPVLRRLWYAQLVSVLGDFLALFAVITVMTFKLHADPQQVVGVQIAYLLPIAVLGIVSGVFVDRWPLKPTMVASDLVRARAGASAAARAQRLGLLSGAGLDQRGVQLLRPRAGRRYPFGGAETRPAIGQPPP